MQKLPVKLREGNRDGMWTLMSYIVIHSEPAFNTPEVPDLFKCRFHFMQVLEA